ncbi:Coiled-coil domain containing protein 109 [Macleaya cordata]|uniref:Coiled-coil domain containing protein 109 n=1 Tax=Macleaya cordata TaxID=56857 RepID=A0A200Q274_MACCD|nr:Coiled-coil domain containing protein 109 [Macleaya cordata]
MAFRKTLANHIYHLTNISYPTLNRPLTKSIFTYQSLQNLIPLNPAQTTFNREFLTTTDAGDRCFRRNLQKRSIGHSTQSSVSPKVPSLPFGDKLIEKLKSINVCKDRLRLDGLIPPLPHPPETEMNQITVKDAKKLLKVAHLEMLKSTLRQIPKKSISYSEFVQICVEGSNTDQGLEFAKMLDESGSVIVLGNTVFLHPEEVTRAIGGIIPLPIARPNDPRKKELEEMEKEKVVIDETAVALVRRELWAGLGFLIAQTAGFMRLTFWELSWDVMEPICFYVTSGYFMAGYTFFMRTSKEPSFEGFFESRFSAKQKQLMKKYKFDIKRFNELKRSCYPSTIYSAEPATSIDQSERTLIGALHH